MTLFEIYKLIEFICNKDFDGNIITPDRFSDLIKVVNIDLFRNKYGLPEGYQPGRPIPVEYADITLKNTDDLKSFKVFLQEETVVAGILSFPNDYAHRDEVVYNYIKSINSIATVFPKGVEILRESEMASRRGNYTKQPTLSNPVGIVRSDGIHIYPIAITSVDFSYYRWPIDPVFAYTLGDGYITYNASSSVEFEWPKDEHITLTRMMLQLIGVNLRDADIVNYSKGMIQNG